VPVESGAEPAALPDAVPRNHGIIDNRSVSLDRGSVGTLLGVNLRLKPHWRQDHDPDGSFCATTATGPGALRTGNPAPPRGFRLRHASRKWSQSSGRWWT
jgi:hypothetical protein